MLGNVHWRQFCVLLLLAASYVAGDLYLHNPRGSNNRLNEASANRKNANRLFDSQNNDRGGYNVGDKTDQASGDNAHNQYDMKYFQSGPWKTLNEDAGRSYLTIEWTNQHGCGGNEDTDPQKQNCNMVLQYMCQPEVDDPTVSKETIKNGVKTDTQDYTGPKTLTEALGERNKRKSNNVKTNRGLHEAWDWYDRCYIRERNKGLFTADQTLKANNGLGYSSSVYTRQNPNGNRYGYECPEERDYFPYWHPTPWVDVAILAQNSSMCSYYQSTSFNVQAYGECIESYPGGEQKHMSRWNNKDECKQNGGTWAVLSNYLEKAPEYKSQSACQNARKAGLRHIWAVPYDAADVTKSQCLVALDKPECSEADWSRSNHLGNGQYGQPLTYTWVLPYFPLAEIKRCVFRMRYNISTDDFDPYNTDQRHNQNLDGGVVSPVQNNPYVDVGGRSPLRLAINTAQYGRVFQDRSHVFILKPRPDNMRTDRVFNLNVRGKRGNIVQVYPAVEYDFVPTTVQLKEGDLLHIQWTGSNTHNNGEPAGDGQVGDDGQGRGGTDRNNLVEIMDLNENFPVPFEKSTLWSSAEIKWIYHGKTSVAAKDLAVNMASAGYYRCIKQADCPEPEHSKQAVDTKAKLNDLLDNAPASYEGAVLKFRKGTHHIMCTRNNDFTNRSHKGSIIVR